MKLTPAEEEIAQTEERRRKLHLKWKDRTQICPAVIELVRDACASGATVGNICAVLDISERKFYRWIDEFPEFAATVKAGRSIEHDRLANRLVEMALCGNVPCLIFALKSRHNYNDAGVGSATLVENKVSFNFILPEALKPGDYLKMLTATSEVIAPGDAARALAAPGVKGTHAHAHTLLFPVHYPLQLPLDHE